MPQNHACSPKAIYLEITGHHEDNAQNEYWLYQGDDAVERLVEGDASEGRFGPIVESQKEFLEEELADYRLVQKIGDIEIPLLQVEEVSQCGLISKQRAFQHNLMVSTVPMLYLDHHELAAGPCRGGFIYVFLQGRLIRELVASSLVNGTLQFLDSDIAAYREQGEVPTVREFSGPALSHVHLPLKLNGETANVRLAFSDHPWPWAHIEQLEANPDLIEKRCQPLALNESAVTVMLQGQGQNLYQHGLEVNRDTCAGKAWLDWLPPMRARDAVYEQAWGSPRDYIEDPKAEGWSALLDQLASERTFFDEQEASFPNIDMARRQRNFSPALRGTLLQQWCNPLRPDEEQADETQLALMPTPAVTEDCFAPLRDQKLCCIFLRDPKQATEHLIADIQASTELLMVLAESMKYHPHGASAELVHANCFMDKSPDGENNPRYLDDWLDRRLDRSRESLFSRLVKIEERRLARLRRDEALSALADLWDDTVPGALVHTLHDAMLFDDINLLEPYVILARSIDILLNGTQPFDPKGTTDELSDYQSPARCQSTLETLYKGEHLASALLFEPEQCKIENVWGEAYARDVGRIGQASQQILSQEANAATMTADDLLALQNQLVKEDNPTADIMRRLLNGADAVVLSTLPPLIAAIPWLNRGQTTMHIDIASNYAELKGALGGGLSFKAELQGGKVVWFVPSEFQVVTAEMAQASAALQATATTNALGGNAVSSSGNPTVRVTGRETSEWRFYGARAGYTAFWAVLAVLELNNAFTAGKEIFNDFSGRSGTGTFSSAFDAALLTAQGLKLANSQWGWSVRINNVLDSPYLKDENWKKAMGDAGQVRGGLTLIAGLLTTALVAYDAHTLAQRGEYRAASWTRAQAAAVGVATVYGSGYGEAAGRISRDRLISNQLVSRVLGWVGTLRPVPTTVISLIASVFFQYQATNNRDDGFSLWVQYGPFGSRRDELESRLAQLATQEDEKDSVAIYDYLIQFRGASPHQTYLYLLQGVHDTYAELVSPRTLVELAPRFADCDIAVKFSCAGLRYGEFQLPPLGVSADYLAPVPDMGFTYQYYPVVKGQRLVASAEAEDPEDNASRYLGISLPREWRSTGIPRSHLGVDPNWLRTSRKRFQHEPDYTREYHQKANLVRLYLDDLTGQGSIQFWNRASRTYRPIEDEMTFTTHPSSLTWVWSQQGAR